MSFELEKKLGRAGDLFRIRSRWPLGLRGHPVWAVWRVDPRHQGDQDEIGEKVPIVGTEHGPLHCSSKTEHYPEHMRGGEARLVVSRQILGVLRSSRESVVAPGV